MSFIFILCYFIDRMDLFMLRSEWILAYMSRVILPILKKFRRGNISYEHYRTWFSFILIPLKAHTTSLPNTLQPYFANQNTLRAKTYWKVKKVEKVKFTLCLTS
jgi:hypothetical protein